jgi:hypothetical protein
MTTSKLRNLQREHAKPNYNSNNDNDRNFWLAEIAIQLAELNKNFMLAHDLTELKRGDE